ncbi:uncharacterized protein MYCGRDRAFT_97650 [Zymoseptoria tritici IPO323]|uniref:Uncharacterized protein n=1 Tax=Zymoseptoria tritici (strain CBS 115943 / IPO323) TaxID=336722 RepID=F9XQW1_ZYMTI|nr:uncharacterized protein MYCGRDRAFT_97650 [Zymoseptoria tritici IPO323]EGP82299.1 hypothetical protein MYCGRDRAFT_97650 [Zymoseptoria tritici IPO323]
MALRSSIHRNPSPAPPDKLHPMRRHNPAKWQIRGNLGRLRIVPSSSNTSTTHLHNAPLTAYNLRPSARPTFPSTHRLSLRAGSRRHADSEDAEKQENKTDSLAHQLAAALSVKHAEGKDNNEEEGEEKEAQGVSLCEAADGCQELGKELRNFWMLSRPNSPAPSIAGGSVRAGRSGGVHRSITPATEYKAIKNGSPTKTPTMMATTTKSKTSINLPNLESNWNYKAQLRAWTTAPYRTYKSQPRARTTTAMKSWIPIAETRQASSAQSERASRRS